MTVWPSGLRRWLQAPVRKGVGSNVLCSMSYVAEAVKLQHAEFLGLNMSCCWWPMALNEAAPPPNPKMQQFHSVRRRLGVPGGLSPRAVGDRPCAGPLGQERRARAVPKTRAEPIGTKIVQSSSNALVFNGYSLHSSDFAALARLPG